MRRCGRCGRANSTKRKHWAKPFIYQSEIASGARELGYRVNKGPTHATEIMGFSKEYLDAESARGKLINDRLEELGMSSSIHARKLVALESREPSCN